MWAPVVVLPPVHDPAHVPRGSVGLHGGDRPHQVAWQTPTIVIYLIARFTRFCISATSFKLNMISRCRDEQEVVISMGGRVEEVKVVLMVDQLNHFDSTTNLFPLQNYNANLFQSLAVTNGHHDSKEDMDMKDDNNKQEVTQDKCLTWHIYKDSGLWLRWKDLSLWPTVALPTPEPLDHRICPVTCFIYRIYSFVEWMKIFPVIEQMLCWFIILLSDIRW